MVDSTIHLLDRKILLSGAPKKIAINDACCCSGNCLLCRGVFAGIVHVQIDGVENFGCDFCTEYNGNWELVDPNPGGDLCRWLNMFGNDCGAFNIFISIVRVLIGGEFDTNIWREILIDTGSPGTGNQGVSTVDTGVPIDDFPHCGDQRLWTGRHDPDTFTWLPAPVSGSGCDFTDLSAQVSLDPIP
jgi:hypothetical protein